MKLGRRQFLSATAALAAVGTSPHIFAMQTSLGPTPDRYPIDAWKVEDERFSDYMISIVP